LDIHANLHPPIGTTERYRGTELVLWTLTPAPTNPAPPEPMMAPPDPPPPGSSRPAQGLVGEKVAWEKTNNGSAVSRPIWSSTWEMGGGGLRPSFTWAIEQKRDRERRKVITAGLRTVAPPRATQSAAFQKKKQKGRYSSWGKEKNGSGLQSGKRREGGDRHERGGGVGGCHEGRIRGDSLLHSVETERNENPGGRRET